MELYTIEIVDKKGYSIYDIRVIAHSEEKSRIFAAYRLKDGEFIGNIK